MDKPENQMNQQESPGPLLSPQPPLYPGIAEAAIGRIDWAVGMAQRWGKTGVVAGATAGGLLGMVAAVIGAVARGACVDAVVLAIFGAVILMLGGISYGAVVGGLIGWVSGLVFGLVRGETGPRPINSPNTVER